MKCFYSLFLFSIYEAYNYRIIAESAHSAYDKAAQYFNIKVRRVPVNKDFLADVKRIKQCINRNTIMVCSNLFYCWYLYDILLVSLDCGRLVLLIF
jgi:aspartate/methionine/tyrosine aminotransferase